MKRSLAFLAAVCLSTVLSATVAFAQYSPPPSQPPTQTPPPPQSDASNDTLKVKSEPPAKAAPAATDTTMSAAAKARRGHLTTASTRTIEFSLGLGSAASRKPEEFNNNFNPSFGGILALGVRQHGLQAGISFNYNFFLANGTVPDDLNIFMAFADLKYLYGKSKALPYVLVCGGYYRQWIVNLNYYENVLGYGGGAGVEMALDKTRKLFVEGRYVEGQTRKDQAKVNSLQENTVTIPFRIGVTWEFK
ncbi:MAG TPA: hypothetical protein VJS69_10285 [Candidatus Krumholzibacteria bacterium]|nr:hypothetical protein [Candidatus Krumholzibacteria bacterium]